MEKSLKKQQNKKARITIALLIVFFISFLLMPGVNFARAFTGTEIVTNLDETKVMDDLLSVDEFNILNYPFVDQEESENSMFVINFVEYCYTFKLDLQENYALYIYVYNPRGIEIDTVRTNKVTMAVEFDNELKPTHYEKFTLEYCDNSTGAYAHLFYKFKIEGADYFLTILNSLQRNYFVSELEMQESGEVNAPASNVSTLFSFTGYAQGFGSSEESTLTCEAIAMESVSLDVQHTYYRTDTNDQINTVYFAVPNGLLNSYGNLYSIHAEWYEFMTKEIIITASQSVYNEILSYIGQSLSASSNKPDFGFGYGMRTISGSTFTSTFYKWAYNIVATGIDEVNLDKLFYIFCTNGVTGNYILDGEILADYIYNYNKTYNSGTLDVNERNISADLFLSEEEFISKYWSSEEGNPTRTMGYNNVNISVEDSVKVSNINTDASWWDLLWGLKSGIVENNISPIYIVEDDVLSLSAVDASNKYLIAQRDLEDFRNYYREQKLQDKTTFLFRFANTKYTQEQLWVQWFNESWWYPHSGYRVSQTEYPSALAQQNVFLDFDIIDLTLTNEGNYYVIPVVSSPIDIISDVEVTLPTPTSWWNWLLIAVIIIAILIALPFLINIFKYLFDAIVWIVSLPFILIGKLVGSRSSPDS